MKSNISIPFINHLNISASLYDAGDEIKPLIIFVHGFKGFKDWGGFPYLLNELSKSGYAALGFNFIYNGVSDTNPTDFTRPDLFAQNTFSQELKELGAVIDYFYSNSKKYKINQSKIAIIGHSRGGGISILKTSTDERIKCLVTLSSVSNFDRYSNKIKNDWKRQGLIEIENTRTKQIMRLNVSLLEDLEKNRDSLNIVSAISKIKVPTLLIHGKEDLAVKFKEANELFNNSDKNHTELLLIENTGHTFGVVHPFKGTTNAFDMVIERIKDFLSRNI